MPDRKSSKAFGENLRRVHVCIGLMLLERNGHASHSYGSEIKTLKKSKLELMQC